MYPVSEAFLRAVYTFGYEDIVKGSGDVSAQCCGSAEIEPGTVYAAENSSMKSGYFLATRRKMYAALLKTG